MILDLSLQPGARLLEQLVRQRRVFARPRQDHRADHRRPAADRRSALLSGILAWGDAAEAFDLLLDACRHFRTRAAGVTDRLRRQGGGGASVRPIVAMAPRQIFGHHVGNNPATVM